MTGPNHSQASDSTADDSTVDDCTAYGSTVDGEASSDPISAAVEQNGNATALFTAPWSPASIMCSRLATDDTIVIDVDDAPELADRWGIWAVPTVIAVGTQGERRRITGASCITEIAGS